MEGMPPDTAVPYEDVHALTMAVLRTGVMLSNLLADLLESLPEDAFPGENHGEVLIEMVSGTVTPVVNAAGLDTVRDAIALLEAFSERVVEHLSAALALAQRSARSRDHASRTRRRPQRSSLS